MNPASQRSMVVSFGPLALIVLVLLGLLGVDVAVNSALNRETALIADNALQSIELVNHMRVLSRRLAAPNVSTAARLTLVLQLTEAGRRYDPLAKFEAEGPEWQQLQRAILQLREAVEQGDRDRVGVQEQAVSGLVDRLAKLNRQQVEASSARIGRLGWQAGLADALAVAGAIGLVVWIGLRQARSAARERALLASNIALVEERNRELDLFASRAAHDLRGPLGPIRGFADLIILGDEPPEEMRQLAMRIRAGADRMLRVVEDMLELSRFGRPAPGRASAAEVCGAVLEEMGASLEGVRVSTALASVTVECSPGLLSQVFRNLIENALKFRATARPLEIEITAKVVDERVVIDVSDNGVGVDPESAEHVFEPYFRGRTDVAGHGLGLAIVERAVRGLGGTCELSSNIDAGARVTIRLPRAVT